MLLFDERIEIERERWAGIVSSLLIVNCTMWRARTSNASPTLMARFICRIIPFSESSYDSPPHIEIMEAKGMNGDTILVEGVKTGSAKVQVKLKDHVYKVCW